MDPIQSPTQQPPPEVFVTQPKPNYLKTILFSILLIITVGLISYLIFQNQKLQKQVINPSVSPTIQVPSPTSQSVSPTPKTVSSISIPPDETAGWKVYKNERFGFQLKYPVNYEVSNKNPNGESTYIMPIGFNKMDEQERGFSSFININVLTSDSNSTPETFVSSAKGPGFDDKRDIKTITIDGKPAIQFMSNNTQLGSGDETNTVIATNQKKELIIISISAQGNSDPYLFPNQILSTFKFTALVTKS